MNDPFIENGKDVKFTDKYPLKRFLLSIALLLTNNQTSVKLDLMRQTLLVIVILMLIASSVSRANAIVIINEFCPNCDPEWVELYNDSETSVDLSGWEIQTVTLSLPMI